MTTEIQRIVNNLIWFALDHEVRLRKQRDLLQEECERQEVEIKNLLEILEAHGIVRNSRK